MATAQELELFSLKALCGIASVNCQEAIALLDKTLVSAADFSTDTHKRLWMALEAGIRAGETPDAVAMTSSLHGLPRALVTDVMFSPELGSAEGRFTALHESALRRRYLAALNSVATEFKDESKPLADSISAAVSLLSEWQQQTRHVGRMDESVFHVLDSIDAVYRGTREPTLATGLAAWDATCGGLQQTLSVLAALPGVGKSAVVAAIIRNLAARNVPVGLISLEDERSWLTYRLLAEASHVPLFLLANKRLRDSQMHSVSECAEKVHATLSHVLVDDRTGLTTQEVVSSARQMVARGAKAIFVDHLGEIRIQRTDRHDLDVAETLGQLRAMAKTHRVPVVVVAHLRRREGLGIFDAPKVTDFAFSAGVERMARVALGLFREKDGGGLRAIILKQNQGMAHLEFRLRLNAQAAIVEDAPVSTTSQSIYGGDE